MANSDAEQCRALTEDGDRCGRPAGEDGFCYQHDENDATVDDSDGDPDGDTEAADGQSDASNQSESGSQADDAAALDGSSVVEIKSSLQSVAPTLLDRELDGVVEVARLDGGWQATVEVVERRSVPDTQDILGQYEVDFDEDGTVTGYRRVDRYRRSDTGRSEGIE